MLGSLLAGIGGAGNGLLSLLGMGQANAQTPLQQPQSPGFGDRLMAGAQGALNSSSPMGAIGNLLGGLSTGARTDPAGVQARAIQGMLGQLVAKGQIDPTTAQFLAANPKAWEELSKAMINVPMQIAPDGSFVQTRPFGQISVPGGVPISDPSKVTNPDGSRSDSYNIRPSLTRPQGGMVVPGQAAPPQAGQPAPRPAAVAGAAPPPLNPNLPNGGRPVISEASPQATKEREGVGSALAEEYKTITAKAASATRQLSTLQRMAQLSPKAFEGAGAPGLQLVRSLLVTAGIPSEKVAAGEEFVSLTNKMILDANNGSLGAGVSNTDTKIVENINPNLAQTAAGRMQIIDMQTKLAKREQEVAKQAHQYRSRNGGSLDGFQVYIQEWANKPENQLFANTQPPAANFNDRFGAVADRPGAAGIRIIGVR